MTGSMQNNEIPDKEKTFSRTLLNLHSELFIFLGVWSENSWKVEEEYKIGIWGINQYVVIVE